jgi:hypothetical protein
MSEHALINGLILTDCLANIIFSAMLTYQQSPWFQIEQAAQI